MAAAHTKMTCAALPINGIRGARSAISRRIFVWTLPDNLAGDCCDDLHAVVQVAGLFKEQELCRKRKLPPVELLG